MRCLALAALPLAACTTFFDGSPETPNSPDGVELRACNATGFDFDTLAYSDFTSGGPLADGACTSYQAAEREIYSYDYIRFAIGDDIFEVIPIDFIGETPLPGGRWTYRLTIVDYENRQIDIEPVED